jgi:hypothetical protein
MTASRQSKALIPDTHTKQYNTIMSEYACTERLIIAPVHQEDLGSWRFDVQIESQSKNHVSLSFPHVVQVQLDMRNLATQRFPTIHNRNGPSGVSVSVWLLDDLDDLVQAQDIFTSTMRQIVRQRFLLAPLASLEKERPQRRIDLRKHPDGLLQLSTVLPFEGSPVSSEGLQAFLQHLVCQDKAGWMSTATSTQWSEALLGSSSDAGLWWDWKNQTVSQGIFYSTTRKTSKANTFSLQDVLPTSSSSLMPCPLADDTSVELVVEKGRLKGPCRSNTLVAKLSNQTSLSDPCFTITEPAPTAPRFAVSFHAQQRPNSGRLITLLENHDSCPVHVQVEQTMESIFVPVWQSLTLTPSSVEVLPDGSTRLGFEYELPALSTFQVSIDYEPAFLPFQRFPGDPNRGFEMTPVHATFTSSSNICVPTTTTLYSNSILLMAPVPDMSMPFNVLSLTCTLYAFVIGSIINQLVRKASESVKKENNKSWKDRIKQALREKWTRLTGRAATEEPNK